MIDPVHPGHHVNPIDYVLHDPETGEEHHLLKLIYIGGFCTIGGCMAFTLLIYLCQGCFEGWVFQGLYWVCCKCCRTPQMEFEDLNTNAFFTALRYQYQEIWAEAAKNQWLICIPQVLFNFSPSLFSLSLSQTYTERLVSLSFLTLIGFL